MTGAIVPEVITHYEALRPVGTAGGLGIPAGRSLLERCGLTLWALTCSAVGPATSGAPGRPGGEEPAPGGSATRARPVALPPRVRDQVVLLLASMVAQRCGGNDGPLRDHAVDTASPAGVA
jgi:hypothetical protein